MLKNIFQNSLNHSCFKMTSFIRRLVLIHLLRMWLLRGKIHLLETARALLFQMHMPKHFWSYAVSTTCSLINQMLASVLNWATPFHTLFPNKSLFPIEPWIFRCTCFVWDVHSQVSKLDPKSLKCIFLGYSRV